MSAITGSLPRGAALDVSKNASAAEAFRSFKGDIETLLAAFEVKDLAFDRKVGEYFHPGRSARAVVNGSAIAEFGQVHPEVAAARKMRQDVFLGEIDLYRLYRLGLRKPQFHPLAKYPAVQRDFSFIFPDAISFEKMRKAIDLLRLTELREFSPAEIFRGGAIGAGKYSILLRALFNPATARCAKMKWRNGRRRLWQLCRSWVEFRGPDSDHSIDCICVRF